MTQTTNEMDERLRGFLDLLRPAPALDPQIAAQERANFLAQVENLRLTVSPKPRERHIEWIDKIKLTFTRKEGSPMISTLLSLVLAISFLFGGAGATVYAAQTSLPDQPLYAVKTWSEQVRQGLEISPQAKLGVILMFTNRRMAEISRQLSSGKMIQPVLIERFQEELDKVLELSAGMDTPQMMKALQQIRRQAETQAQTMSDWMNSGTGQVDPALAQMRDRLREQARLAVMGETDPDTFRLQIRDRDRLKMRLQTPQPTQMNAADQTPIVTPVGENNSYGPGPFTGQPTSAPGGYNNGPGPNPTNAGSAGYGPGPQVGSATCTPVLDGTGPGPGPQPTSSGTGGGGAGPQHPTVDPGSPGDSGSGNQATPQGNGNPGNSQTTISPGNGGRP